MRYLDTPRGFTLVEVMIAVVIGFLLIAAASATYISQNRSYVAQESTSEVNTQSRIAHDIIADAVRRAGFGVPWDLSTNQVNGTQDIIETSVDSTAGTDAITIVSGRLIGQLWPVGVGPSSGALCPPSPNQYEIPMSNTYDIQYAGNDRPNTTDMRWMSIDGIEVVEAVLVSNPGNSVTFTRTLTRAYPMTDETGDGTCDTGRPVYLIEDTTFCVDGNNVLRRIRRNAVLPGCTPSLTSDDQAIAENIQDLQFAYAVDANVPLGIIDDLDGDNMLSGGDFVDGAAVADDTDIRAVRINILAMSDKPDITYQGLGSPPLAIENRVYGAVAADNFKRRWWQSIVKMRNQ